MFCNNCGRQIEEGSKFCNACGQPVEEPTSAQVTSSPSQTPEPQPPPPQRKSSGFPRPLKWALIVEPYFVGPAGLTVKSTAEPFQLPAQLSVGHAATVKLPLPVLLVGIAVNAPETVLLLPPQRPFGGVETGSSMARWRLSGMLLCCVASAAGLPGWRPTRGLARKSLTGIPRRAGTSETGTEELLSPEPLALLPWEPARRTLETVVRYACWNP